MTSRLRKAHKYIWLLLIIIVPVIMFYSIKALELFSSGNNTISQLSGSKKMSIKSYEKWYYKSGYFWKSCWNYSIDNNRVAIFKYDGKLSAIHNVCKQQSGPLGAGRIIDGFVTCRWHGYQYLPSNGQSPPPFT